MKRGEGKVGLLECLNALAGEEQGVGFGGGDQREHRGSSMGRRRSCERAENI